MTRFALAPVAAACALLAAATVHAESTGDAATRGADPITVRGALQGGLPKAGENAQGGSTTLPAQRLTDPLTRASEERGDEENTERDEAGNLLGERLVPGSRNAASMSDDDDDIRPDSSSDDSNPLAGLEGTENSGEDEGSTSRSLGASTSLRGSSDGSSVSGSGSASVEAGEGGGSGSGGLSVGSGSAEESDSDNRQSVNVDAGVELDPGSLNTSEDASSDDDTESDFERAGEEAGSEFEEGAENVEDEASDVF